jgi:hypothetical protein
MKHSLAWAATHLKKPGCFCAFQIVAGLIGVNAAGILFSHLQALGQVAADSIGNRGGDSSQPIAALARLSGDIEISLIAPLAGAVIGMLLTIIFGIIGNPSSRGFVRPAVGSF